MSHFTPFALHFDFRNLDFLAIKSSDGKLFWTSGKISSFVTC